MKRGILDWKKMTRIWFEGLADSEMLLVLCIREEELDNPAAWCQEFRAFCRDTKDGPKTVGEAEAMVAKSASLSSKIRKN